MYWYSNKKKSPMSHDHEVTQTSPRFSKRKSLLVTFSFTSCRLKIERIMFVLSSDFSHFSSKLGSQFSMTRSENIRALCLRTAVRWHGRFWINPKKLATDNLVLTKDYAFFLHFKIFNKRKIPKSIINHGKTCTCVDFCIHLASW